MTALQQIEIQPRLSLQTIARGLSALWMERDQVAPAVAFLEPRRHLAPHLLHARWIAVAAENPDDVRPVFVALPEDPPIHARLLRRENHRAGAPGFHDLVSPRRQQADVQPALARQIDHLVDMPEIGFIDTRGIIADQRPLAFRVGRV